MKILGVIPARYQSSRLPGKPLADILGKPMLWWVYRAASRCARLDGLVVATDDERILKVCAGLGLQAVMTSPDHDTPTARIHEVSTRLNADLYLQIMGDEPLIDPRALDLILPAELPADPFYVAGVTNRMDHPADVIDFSNQKVACNARREILMISRSPIPYPKGTLDFEYEKRLFRPSILESNSFNLSIIHDIALGKSSNVMFFSLILLLVYCLIFRQSNSDFKY